MQDAMIVLVWVVAIIVVSLALVASHKLLVGKFKVDAVYAFKVLVIAFIVVFIIPVFNSIISPYISEFAIIIAYTIIILLVRLLLCKQGSKIPWDTSIAISFIAFLIIFIINFISQSTIGVAIVQF
ncbi:MAG: hypothetical protein ACTSYQ_05265 [Candidatus Odinarchaeia archaeon]